MLTPGPYGPLLPNLAGPNLFHACRVRFRDLTAITLYHFVKLKLEDIESVVRRVLDERRGSPWLKTEEAAAYLGSTVGTMKTWRI